MNEKIITNKENVATAIMDYRKSLLEEFLLIAPKLRKEINELCETGVNEKLFICLEDSEAKLDPCYSALSKKMLLDLLNILDKMNNENAMQVFKNFIKEPDVSHSYLFYYPEYRELENILYAYEDAQFAERTLNIKHWSKNEKNSELNENSFSSLFFSIFFFNQFLFQTF